jgi:hypothetical protein
MVNAPGTAPAALLGYASPRSVHDLRRAGKLSGRRESAGLHEVRWFYRRAEVVALKAEETER